MRTRIYLSVLAIALIALLVNTSYSQEKECCKDKSTSHCGDMKTEDGKCCDNHGNAGGDSTTTNSMICPVGKEPISEGQAVKFDYYGVTYNFCCEGCLAKFKKEPMDYMSADFIKAGGLTCPVMGDAIESKDVFIIHEGTKYYLCCAGCEGKFKKNPEKYINKKN